MNDGEGTTLSHYIIDFVNMAQTNIDNQRKHSIRIVWVHSEDVQVHFTGEVPTERTM